MSFVLRLLSFAFGSVETHPVGATVPSIYDTIFHLASIDAFSSSQYFFHENDQTTAHQVALYQQMACALVSFFPLFFERERDSLLLLWSAHASFFVLIHLGSRLRI